MNGLPNSELHVLLILAIMFIPHDAFLNSHHHNPHHHRHHHPSTLFAATPHATLNLTPPSTPNEIKRAYRKLALKYHPDVNKSPGAETKFLEIQKAYNMLTDPAGVEDFMNRQGASSASGSTWREKTTSKAKQTWEDYQRKTDAIYDTGGDSFSSIFSDLVGSVSGTVGNAAGIKSSGKSLLVDLVDFLEGNVVDNFGTVDDEVLFEVLQSTDVNYILKEVGETEEMVVILGKKLEALEKRRVELELENSSSEWGSNSGSSTNRSEQMEAEIERIGEQAGLKTKKKIVDKHLKKSRDRLVKMQARAKELLQGRRAERKKTPTTTPKKAKPKMDDRRLLAQKADDELKKMKKDLGL